VPVKETVSDAEPEVGEAAADAVRSITVRLNDVVRVVFPPAAVTAMV
jgi:hypothetical protein